MDYISPALTLLTLVGGAALFAGVLKANLENMSKEFDKLRADFDELRREVIVHLSDHPKNGSYKAPRKR